jgi:hypothetical protein
MGIGQFAEELPMGVILSPDLPGRRVCFGFSQDLWIPASAGMTRQAAWE